MKKGFTLIEIMVAVSLSLLLLLGVAEMFRRVGTMIDDTTTTQTMTNNLSEVSLMLRRDLGNLRADVQYPKKLADGDAGALANAPSGYLEIYEGNQSSGFMDSLNGSTDLTAGDVDDVIMFTATDVLSPYRGLIDGNITERDTAEIAWFVRGNKLYRRVLLLDDKNLTAPVNGNYSQNDLSVDKDGKKNTLMTLAIRENRFAHHGLPTVGGIPGSFPNSSWLTWLMMPVLGVNNDMIGANSHIRTGEKPNDLWEWKPPEAELSLPRVNEDVILTNVISFDVKVWSGTGFTDLTGLPPIDTNLPPRVNFTSAEQCVFDTWTKDYIELGGYKNCVDNNNPTDDEKKDWAKWQCPPPYIGELKGIEITIRVFDPASRNIKQIQVVHKF